MDKGTKDVLYEKLSNIDKLIQLESIGMDMLVDYILRIDPSILIGFLEELPHLTPDEVKGADMALLIDLVSSHFVLIDTEHLKDSEYSYDDFEEKVLDSNKIANGIYKAVGGRGAGYIDIEDAYQMVDADRYAEERPDLQDIRDKFK